mmetsp:Transcript_5640/g.15870  ORF Transcript_5640/g.15870 Transcript_5640/m.15870 type:complete len:241 (+) Transcript_5640:615-1337(+)
MDSEVDRGQLAHRSPRHRASDLVACLPGILDRYRDDHQRQQALRCAFPVSLRADGVRYAVVLQHRGHATHERGALEHVEGDHLHLRHSLPLLVHPFHCRRNRGALWRRSQRLAAAGAAGQVQPRAAELAFAHVPAPSGARRSHGGDQAPYVELYDQGEGGGRDRALPDRNAERVRRSPLAEGVADVGCVDRGPPEERARERPRRRGEGEGHLPEERLEAWGRDPAEEGVGPSLHDVLRRR